MKKIFLVFFLFIVFTNESYSQSNVSIGFELEPLPFISDGYYTSLWLGFDQAQIRLRPVFRKLNQIPLFLKEGVERETIKTYQMMIDYFFNPEYRGLWITSGVEYAKIELESKSNLKTSYYKTNISIGGGYVWKFDGNLYLNPYFQLNFKVIGDNYYQVENYLYKTSFFSYGIGIRLGWYF